jgi:hypothetical protein
LIRIPEQWTLTNDAWSVIDSAVQKVMRQSNRLVALLLAWEHWTAKGEGSRVQFYCFVKFNERASFYAHDIPPLLTPSSLPPPKHWTSIDELVHRCLPAWVAYFNRRK